MKQKSIKSPVKRSKIIITTIAVLALLAAFSYGEVQGWAKVPLILNEIKPPVFPARDFDLLNFGAKGDSTFDNTQAFRSAIAACHQAGGGRVVVPQGIFLTGAIHLQSNVNLFLSQGSVIRFSRDPRHYLPVVFTRFEGVECINYSPFIYAYGAENIAITGSGTLDGNADDENWWYWAGKKTNGWKESLPAQKEDRDALFRMGEQGVPVESRIFGAGHYLRPNFIQFYRSQRILIEGITIIRSPMWEIHPVLCENVTVQKVIIISHGPNNDGCNPESSKNVLIRACYFDTGDDCIAIKSGRDTDGRRLKVPSENIIIQDCVMKDGHGGVVIGSEMSGDCRNIFAERCKMDSPNLDRALRIKTNSLRGSIVENIYMRDVSVGKVSEAVVLIDLYYSDGDVGKHTPIVRNIFVSNVTSQQSRYALSFNGYARSPITDVVIENCRFDNVAEKSILSNVKGLQLRDVYINGQLQPATATP